MNSHLSVHTTPYPIDAAVLFGPTMAVLLTIQKLGYIALSIRPLIRAGRYWAACLAIGENRIPNPQILLSMSIKIHSIIIINEPTLIAQDKSPFPTPETIVCSAPVQSSKMTRNRGLLSEVG